MLRTILPTVLLGMTLLTSGMTSADMTAEAASCLSARDARAAVQSGQAAPLSQMLGSIRSAAGGEIVPPPMLCRQGSRLVYVVNVLLPGGKVKKLTVDAASGSILGN
jgi:uncharacterized membrane protein YkoI